MGDTRQDNPSGTRERILEVCAGLFRDVGYERTSTDDIGAKLGISGPAIYHHFAGKQVILYILCERATAEQIERGREARREPTPLEQLRAFVHGDCRYQLESLRAAREYGSGSYTFAQLMRSLSAEDQRRINAMRRTLFQIPRGIIHAGIADGSFEPVDPTATTFALFGMTQQAVSWFSFEGRLSIEQLADMYAGFAAKLVLPGGSTNGQAPRSRPARPPTAAPPA